MLVVMHLLLVSYNNVNWAFSLSVHGILCLSLAVSTTEHPCSREAAFFNMYEGFMFAGLRSDLLALNHMWLGLAEHYNNKIVSSPMIH